MSGRRFAQGPGGQPVPINPDRFGGRTPPPVGNSVVRDAMGRILLQGDQIFVETGQQTPFEVIGITPIVDPSVPNGEYFLDVTLRAGLRFRCTKDQVNQEFIRIASKAEFMRPEDPDQTQRQRDDQPDPPPPLGPETPEAEEHVEDVIEEPERGSEK